MAPRILNRLLALLIVMTLCGCGSIRYSSTIKPGSDKEAQIGSQRYCLSTFAYDTDKKKPVKNNQPSPELIFERAKAMYPNIFTDEWTALPIMVSITGSHDGTSQQLAYFLTGFCTLGLIPFPGTEEYDFKIDTSLSDSLGQRLHQGHGDFTITKGEWGSIFPWGALPVPGFSDLPRDYSFGDEDYLAKARTKIYNYAADCIVETVVKDLRAADQAKLAAAYAERKTLCQEIALDGKTYQGFLLMTPAKPDKPGGCTVLLYQGTPRRTVKPLEEVVVARQEPSGQWRPVNGYLRTARSLTAASVLLIDGTPSKIAVRPVAEPPLADFIDTPDLGSPDRNAILRWSNGVLLDAKNRSLNTMIKEANREELVGLITRIEQAILDLNEKSEQAKDRAQGMVEKGGDPAPERELSVLLRQRIEILKPVLAALKQA